MEIVQRTSFLAVECAFTAEYLKVVSQIPGDEARCVGRQTASKDVCNPPNLVKVGSHSKQNPVGISKLTG